MSWTYAAVSGLIRLAGIGVPAASVVEQGLATGPIHTGCEKIPCLIGSVGTVDARVGYTITLLTSSEKKKKVLPFMIEDPRSPKRGKTSGPPSVPPKS